MAIGDPPVTGGQIQWNPPQLGYQAGLPTPTCPTHKSWMRYIAFHGRDKTVWWCDACAEVKKAEREACLAERQAKALGN